MTNHGIMKQVIRAAPGRRNDHLHPLHESAYKCPICQHSPGETLLIDLIPSPASRHDPSPLPRSPVREISHQASSKFPCSSSNENLPLPLPLLVIIKRGDEERNTLRLYPLFNLRSRFLSFRAGNSSTFRIRFRIISIPAVRKEVFPLQAPLGTSFAILLLTRGLKAKKAKAAEAAQNTAAM